jgi:hypothetical protein
MLCGIDDSSFRDHSNYPDALVDYFGTGGLALDGTDGADFPYSPSLSAGKRLVFVQDGNSPLAWALMIDKTDGSTTYRYPPRLVLIDRMQKKKLKDEHIIFANVIEKPFVGYTDGARCLETELLYFLPRSRRLIGFYAPFLGEAMSYASQRG